MNKHSFICFPARTAGRGNARTPAEMDACVWDLQTDTPQLVCSGGGIFAPGGWAPTGSRLLVLQAYANTNQDIWLVDPARGKHRRRP